MHPFQIRHKNWKVSLMASIEIVVEIVRDKPTLRNETVTQITQEDTKNPEISLGIFN